MWHLRLWPCSCMNSCSVLARVVVVDLVILVKIEDVRRSVSRVFSNPVYFVPPSMALAPNKVIDEVPVV